MATRPRRRGIISASKPGVDRKAPREYQRYRARFSFLLLALTTACAFALSSCATAERGFESGTFRGWFREFPDRESAQIVEAPVRAGRYAAEFIVGPDAREIRGGPRSEVSELWYKAQFGVEHWYRFSTYIPDDWPYANVRCVIAQWHAWPDLIRGEAWRSPVVAFEYRLDRFIVRICHNDEKVQTDNSQASNNKQVLYQSQQVQERERWHDFVVAATFDPFGEGRLRVWQDGILIVDYQGPLGYNDRAGPWFKMGIYRDVAPDVYRIYHDDYRRGRSPESIDVDRASLSSQLGS